MTSTPRYGRCYFGNVDADYCLEKAKYLARKSGFTVANKPSCKIYAGEFTSWKDYGTDGNDFLVGCGEIGGSYSLDLGHIKGDRKCIEPPPSTPLPTQAPVRKSCSEAKGVCTPVPGWFWDNFKTRGVPLDCDIARGMYLNDPTYISKTFRYFDVCNYEPPEWITAVCGVNSEFNGVAGCMPPLQSSKKRKNEFVCCIPKNP
ncbi:hypothetical protein BGX26_002085 [Mortierella sp. AD094]|nr:hypothetical protein BGX26_002085 [Mortierella sp. AD094]